MKLIKKILNWFFAAVLIGFVVIAVQHPLVGFTFWNYPVNKFFANFDQSDDTNNPLYTYDGSPYSGTDFQLSADENRYYQHCRQELVNYGRYFLTASAETGCACIADNLGPKVKNGEWKLHETMMSYKRDAELNDQVKGGFLRPIGKFATDKKVHLGKAERIYADLRTTEKYCMPTPTETAKKIASPKKPTKSKVKESGKTQTVRFVDKAGREHKVTVPGSKGVMVYTDENGKLVIKAR